MRLVDHSPEELPAGAAVWLNRFDMRAGDSFGTHVHDDLHQLCWSPVGVLRAEAGSERWVLPPSAALWIPVGLPHDVGSARPARLHSVYVLPDRCPIGWTAPTVVGVDRLLAEVLQHLAGDASTGAARARAEQFMFDLLRPVGTEQPALRVPSDPRAAAVADALLRTPADSRTLEQWGREVGASGRTLARHFLEQTGISFGEWRAQARVHAAIALLASGGAVGAVAAAVGYRDPSSFANVFRRHVGATPATFTRAT